MAETCVDSFMSFCSTDAPGWLSGGHPTVAEGAVRRKVCFAYLFGCCSYPKYISVRNCGAFFVYKLEPPRCNLRYCGNGVPQAPGGHIFRFFLFISSCAQYIQSSFFPFLFLPLSLSLIGRESEKERESGGEDGRKERKKQRKKERNKETKKQKRNKERKKAKKRPQGLY